MTAAQLLELDAIARREALQVARSLLLQAPAGSGKTTVLTARFLALLAVVDAPEQVLAITFTRKAAAEMRHRIITALHAAATGQQIPGIEPAVLQSAAQRDRTRGWQLRNNPTRLRVETIDALNHSLAAASPVAAGSGPSLQVNTVPAPLYRRAARGALHAALREPEYANSVLGLFERLDNRWERLEQLLADMLAERSHWLPRVLDARAEGLAERVLQSLDSLLRVQLAGAQARLPAALLLEAQALLAHAAGVGAVTPADPALSSDPACLPSWRALCALALTDNGCWRRRLTVREGFGPDEAAMKRRALDWIAALQAHPQALATLLEVRTLPDARLSAGDQDALEALTVLLTRAAAELQLVFSDSGQVDYVYVAAAARQALSQQGEPSELALHSSGALRHVLIDEFQDTSIEQFELLRALCVGWERGDGRTLFIVGDPMQSIYQFREAEVGLFLRARTHGVAGIRLETLQLRRNFRSSAPLIDWINARFAQLFPADDDSRLAAVRFLGSVPARPLPDAPTPAVTLHRCAPEDARAEARRVVAIVQAARARRPEATVAVLVASRQHASTIVTSLRTAGFQPRGVDLEPLGDRAVIRDLCALARVLLHGADRSAWLAVLRAPWCGLQLAELEQLLEGAEGDLFSTLSAASRSAEGSSRRLARLCDALEPALTGAERDLPLWQRLERAWLRSSGPAIYPNAAEQLDAYRLIDALAIHDDPDSLVGEAMTASTGRLYASAPPQPGAIEVMTMHAAKGLEWDVVILPSLHRRTAIDSDPLLHWIELPRSGEGTDLLLAPIRTTEQPSPGSLGAYIKSLRRTRHQLERVRLLYVAATRAREELHLLGALASPSVSGQSAAPQSGSLLDVLWPAIGTEFSALAVAAQSDSSPTADAAATSGRDAAFPLRRLPLSWAPPATPEPPMVQRLALSAAISADAPEYSWVGLTARAIGTIVHAELHRLAAGASLPAPSEQAFARDYSSWLAELGVAPAEWPAAQARIREALRRTVSDADGRWVLSNAHAQARSEWRLSGLHEGRVVNVVLDRMFVDALGRRWIVDFKTSSHEGGAVHEFIAQELQRHRSQLERYAALAAGLGSEPVRVALYFPLLGALRELPLAAQPRQARLQNVPASDNG